MREWLLLAGLVAAVVVHVAVIGWLLGACRLNGGGNRRGRRLHRWLAVNGGVRRIF